MMRFAVAAALAAMVVALIGTADHRHKRQVEFAAQEDAWFCAHGRPSACRDFDQVAYEQRWENREFAYRVTFFVFTVTAVGLGMIVLRQRTAART